ncbi:MAG: hypothetical protein U1F22_01420 [Lysobacterales bacterium]
MPLRRLLSFAAALSLPLAAVAAATPPPAERPVDGLSWRLVGPHRGGWAMMAVGVPQQPDTYYFAAAGGGVWKTRDSGRTWQPVGDALPPSIGAIAIAPSAPQTVYAGTGQVTTRYDIAAGAGVFKSVDGGAHWQALGLEATRHIGRVWIDPRRADTVLVAALGHAFGPNPERGVYRSEDGGSTWERTLFVSENTGAVDLAADPQNPDVVFAAAWQMRQQPWQSYFTPDVGEESGIWKSTDGGRHWQRLSGGGWPAHALGRIGLSAAHLPNGATRLYAIVDAETDGGLWRSDDGGTSWTHANADGELVNGYFSRVTVDPRDPDVVWTGGRGIHRCAQGGAVCDIVKGAPGGDDYHFVWLNPQDPQRLVTAADQGVVVSVNGGASWSSWYNQPTGQFYHLAADNRFPYRIYSGQQDSGTVGIASRSDYGAISFRDWQPVGADERDYDIPDPVDPDIVYGSGLGGRLSRWDARTGEVQNIAPWPIASYGKRPTSYQVHYTWITPIAVSQRAPHPLYLGAQWLYRSTDRGAHWETISPDLSAKSKSGKECEGNLDRPTARACGYGVIYSIGLSPRDNDEVWLGTDDGAVKLTRDAGKTWRDVTPPDVPAWAKIATVDVPPHSPGTAYIAVDNHRQDDFAPRAFVTHDYGASWRAIGAGLPSGHYVGVLRADPLKPGLLYAGTDDGVQISFDDGAHWQSLQRNLPRAWVRDLLVHGDDLIAATQGRALWVLDNVSPLRQMDRAPAHGQLFAPATALRLRGSQNKDTPLPPEEPVGTNPPQGAMFDYWLARPARGEVALEVRDAQDRLVRRFASSDQPEGLDVEDRYFAQAWVRPRAPLSAAAGMHRFVWNLRYPRPQAAQYGYSIAAIWGEDTPVVPEGPLVPPGDYRVSLSVDGKATSTQTLHVVADPRRAFDAAAAQSALAFSQELQAALQRDYAAQLEVRWLSKQSAALRKAGGDNLAAPARAALDALDAGMAPLLKGEGDRGPNLAAIGDIIGSMEVDIEGSDAAPIAAQREALRVSLERLEAAEKRWVELRAKELTALNAALRASGSKALTIPPLAQMRAAK